MDKIKQNGKTLKGKYRQYKNDAKKRDIEFKLTFEEFSLLWNKNCYYCNSKIDTIGIDRIDSSLCYEINNCRPCCFSCNSMKSNKTEMEWYVQMILILRHQNLIP
jgi:hypothetical protein